MMMKIKWDDDENKEDYPPRKLILYGYIVESDEGEILSKSCFNFFSEEEFILIHCFRDRLLF